MPNVGRIRDQNSELLPIRLRSAEALDRSIFDSLVSERVALPFNKGGGGTAELDSGEESSGSLDLMMVASPDELVGFDAHLWMNGGNEKDDKWLVVRWVNLLEESLGDQRDETNSAPD